MPATQQSVTIRCHISLHATCGHVQGPNMTYFELFRIESLVYIHLRVYLAKSYTYLHAYNNQFRSSKCILNKDDTLGMSFNMFGSGLER